jgi:hypothetical protein
MNHRLLSFFRALLLVQYAIQCYNIYGLVPISSLHCFSSSFSPSVSTCPPLSCGALVALVLLSLDRIFIQYHGQDCYILFISSQPLQSSMPLMRSALPSRRLSLCLSVCLCLSLSVPCLTLCFPLASLVSSPSALTLSLSLIEKVSSGSQVERNHFSCRHFDLSLPLCVCLGDHSLPHTGFGLGSHHAVSLSLSSSPLSVTLSLFVSLSASASVCLSVCFSLYAFSLSLPVSVTPCLSL